MACKYFLPALRLISTSLLWFLLVIILIFFSQSAWVATVSWSDPVGSFLEWPELALYTFHFILTLSSEPFWRHSWPSPYSPGLGLLSRPLSSLPTGAFIVLVNILLLLRVQQSLNSLWHSQWTQLCHLPLAQEPKSLFCLETHVLLKGMVLWHRVSFPSPDTTKCNGIYYSPNCDSFTSPLIFYFFSVPCIPKLCVQIWIPVSPSICYRLKSSFIFF